MDKALRRHITAERIRRTEEARAQARMIRHVKETAFDSGFRAGRAQGSPLPRDFMDAVIAKAVSNLAREVAARISEDQTRELTFVAVRVAEKVLQSAPWNPLDEATMACWTQIETLDLRLRFSIPALTWNVEIPHRKVQMARWR